MSHIESLASTKYPVPENMSVQQGECRPLVLVIDDNSALSRQLKVVCDFLSFQLEHVSPDERLLAKLEERRPMAVISELDGERQDGCFVLMTVSEYDRGLPVLMVTGTDPALAGAVDAVEEVWGLSGVVQSPALPSVGAMVEFLFLAGRRLNLPGLMRA